MAAFQADIESMETTDAKAAPPATNAGRAPLPPPPMPPPPGGPPQMMGMSYGAPTTVAPVKPKVQVVYGSKAVIERQSDGSAPPTKKTKAKAPPGFNAKKKAKKNPKKVAPTVALPPRMQETKDLTAKEELQAMKEALLQSAPAPEIEKPFIHKLVDEEAPSISSLGHKALAANEKRLYLRKAAGKIWNDTSLAEWPDADHRIFVGDLGNEVNDNTLAKVFVKYTSFAKAKVIRDKRTQKTKGYGFVSFLDPFDAVTALKEMQGCYVGNRPIKLRKSKWGQRTYEVKKKRTRKGNHTF